MRKLREEIETVHAYGVTDHLRDKTKMVERNKQMAKMTLGYIRRNNLELNPQITEKFRLIEAPYTQSISSRGNKVRSKMFHTSLDYEDVAFNTELMKERNNMIVVQEPFFMDDELRERVTKWVEWANNADPKEYDPFAE